MKFNPLDIIIALIDVLSNPTSIIGSVISIIISICVICFFEKRRFRKSYILFIPSILSGVFTFIGVWECICGGTNSLFYLGITLFFVPFFAFTFIICCTYYIIKLIIQKNK